MHQGHRRGTCYANAHRLEPKSNPLTLPSSCNYSGNLDVSLIDGCSLGFGQEYLIADVEGSMTGILSGLNEGSLVGNLGGQDLFITYNGYGGNAWVGLFTSVPEPSSALVPFTLGSAAVVRRCRRCGILPKPLSPDFDVLHQNPQHRSLLRSTYSEARAQDRSHRAA